jgi:uncharacterized Tic20 family protein
MPFEDVPPSRPASEQYTDAPRKDGAPQSPLEAVPTPGATSSPGELTAEERQWAMFAHLSALVGLLVGGLTFLGPLIVWLIKKDESKFVDYHGKEALNFQLNILIYNLICVGIGIATCTIGFVVTGPLMGVIFVLAIVMPIIAGLKANEGKLYEYPLTFRLIK